MDTSHAAFSLCDRYASAFTDTIDDFGSNSYASLYVAPQSHSYTIGCFATRDTRTRSHCKHGHSCLVVALASLHYGASRTDAASPRSIPRILYESHPVSNIISLETYRRAKHRSTRVPILRQYNLPEIFGIKAAIAIMRKSTPAPVVPVVAPTVIRLIKPEFRQAEKVSPGDRAPNA